jgi:hypothetical protein
MMQEVVQLVAVTDAEESMARILGEASSTLTSLLESVYTFARVLSNGSTNSTITV